MWTFPLPHASSFADDPGHKEVIVDMQSYEKDFNVIDKTTKTGKGIWIFTRKDREAQVTQRGIAQEGYTPDSLPFVAINYKCYDRNNTKKAWVFS